MATARIELTADRDEAERNANIQVVATHAAQSAAKTAKSGNKKKAKLEIRAAQRFLQRNAKESDVTAWSSNVQQMDDVLDSSEESQEEVRSNNNNDVMVEEKPKRKKKKKKAKDRTAKNVSKMANVGAMDLFD